MPANPGRTFISGNCSPVRPDNPGSIFVFDANGRARPFNFGAEQPHRRTTSTFSGAAFFIGGNLKFGAAADRN